MIAELVLLVGSAIACVVVSKSHSKNDRRDDTDDSDASTHTSNGGDFIWLSNYKSEPLIKPYKPSFDYLDNMLSKPEPLFKPYKPSFSYLDNMLSKPEPLFKPYKPSFDYLDNMLSKPEPLIRKLLVGQTMPIEDEVILRKFLFTPALPTNDFFEHRAQSSLQKYVRSGYLPIEEEVQLAQHFGVSAPLAPIGPSGPWC